MEPFATLVVWGLLTFSLLTLSTAAPSENSIIRQREVLESKGKVVVEWEVDFTKKRITFDVTAETTGYVGFGLSPGGGMAGSDMVVGGIKEDGSSYFSDYHGEGDFAPVLDDRQDWRLISAFENTTHTLLRVTRLLDTCDPDDVPINRDTLSLIWAIGDTDNLSYHEGQRGGLSVNLLDPPQSPTDTSSFSSWKMTVNQTMPSDKTYSYWCTIFKGPEFGGKKHHVVGFRPVLNGALASKHTHHQVIYRCIPPPGKDPRDVFGPYADPAPGDNCYTKEAEDTRPSPLCSIVVFGWGTGGKEMFLPDHAGYSVGEDPHEYYMLEIHYDNPEQIRHAKFETGMEVFYTPTLRRYDAGMMTISHMVVASLMIPPKQKDFLIVGHCSEHCTQLVLPPEGMTIFNILMHTHLQGRRVKLRQFRNGTELPWVSYDEHYRFKYQKNRPLREARKILPGDQLSFECHFDTSAHDTLTTAGYSTHDEMCESFIWYYPKLAIDSCGSYYPIEKLYERFGIKEVEWHVGLEGGPQPVITSPAHMANKTFREALDENVEWTPGMVKELQEMLVTEDHVSICKGDGSDGGPPPRHGGVRRLSTVSGRNEVGDSETEITEGPPPTLTPAEVKKFLRVNYPKVEKEYKPPQACSDKDNDL